MFASFTAAVGTTASRADDNHNGGQPFTATFSPSAVSVGVTAATVNFSVVVANKASNLTIKSANITAPSGITLVSVSPPAAPGTATISGGVIQLRNISIAPTKSATYSFVATVPPPPSATPVVYTWTVEAKPTTNFSGTNDHDSDDFDINAAGSQLKLTATQTPRGDLAVAFGDGTTPADQPDPATPNNDVLYTIKVTNNGPADQTSVSLTDAMTGGGTITQIPAAGSGAGFTCTIASGGGSASCSYGALVSGSSAVIQVWVHAPATSATMTNTASVSGTAPDPNTTNNSAAEATTVSSAAACPATSVSCARSFLNFSQPSTASTGDAASAAVWIVGSANFPATSSTGGTLYNMDAPTAPGTYCPLQIGSSVLTNCDFEMAIDPVPSVYTGNNVTLNLECDKTKCPVGLGGTTGGFVLVKVTTGSNSPQIQSRCSAGQTTPCYTIGVSPTTGNFRVTMKNIPAGDPKYAGKCYVQCTPSVG
jgi:uncharacterized repeat protein (TIGR01451 family)